MFETGLPTLPPALDVPPEQPFQAGAIAAGGAEVAGGILTAELVKQAVSVLKVGGELALLIFLFTHVKEILALWDKYVAPELKELGSTVTTSAAQLIEPVSDLFGELSKAYVGEIGRHYRAVQGGGIESTGTPAGNAAKYAFDSIVSPIAFFTSGSDPSADGAGQRNIQQTLGLIVQLHLVTWVVNVISNLTGIGALKFMNSFTAVILDALNARSFSRVAMKPYLTTFISEPATKELNTKWPLKEASAGALTRQFLRGEISLDQLKAANLQKGFDANQTANLVLETAHLMTPSDAGFFIRIGVWTLEQGEQALVMAGYEKDVAHAALTRELDQLRYDLQKRYADELGKRVVSHDMTGDEYIAILEALGFTHLEAQAYAQIHLVAAGARRRLTYAQVRALYLAAIVPLQFVQDFLTGENYTREDADLLTLLDFTTETEQKARKGVLAAQARVLALEKASASATATTKQQQALAAALDALSKAKAKLAATFGG